MTTPTPTADEVTGDRGNGDDALAAWVDKRARHLADAVLRQMHAREYDRLVADMARSVWAEFEVEQNRVAAMLSQGPDLSAETRPAVSNDFDIDVAPPAGPTVSTRTRVDVPPPSAPTPRTDPARPDVDARLTVHDVPRAPVTPRPPRAQPTVHDRPCTQRSPHGPHTHNESIEAHDRCPGIPDHPKPAPPEPAAPPPPPKPLSAQIKPGPVVQHVDRDEATGRPICGGCHVPIRKFFACGCTIGDIAPDGTPKDPEYAAEFGVLTDDELDLDTPDDIRAARSATA